MRKMLNFDSMGKERALEVACGPAIVTKELLYPNFEEIDIFDENE